MRNIIKVVKKNPAVLLSALNRFAVVRNMKDEKYLKILFRLALGKKLNLENPSTLNEKLQWLKLHNRNPEYVNLVDKYEVKKTVADIIGDEYIIPTLGVWDNFRDIDFESLPQQFVLKCTHDSGGLVICKDKRTLDIAAAKKKINKSLARNYYYLGREWPYKDVKPRIIAEKYMEDLSGGLVDYKFFCFNGNVDSVMVCRGRNINKPKFYFFDTEWNFLEFIKPKRQDRNIESIKKPDCFAEMLQIASTLSKGHPFIRVDLFESNGQVYFGELTFFPDSGIDNGINRIADEHFGKNLKIKELT